MDADDKLLRIYTDESAFFGDRKVFQEIAVRARNSGLAGVTVLRALLGFGPSAHVHRKHVLEDEQALVVEIIDKEAKVRSFAAQLDDLPGIGLITVETVEVVRRGART